MKAIPCEIIFNTRWGYVFQPIKFPSISKALAYAEERGEAYRIFVDGKCIRSGWIVN